MGSNVQGIVTAFHINHQCASSVVTLLRQVLRHQELKKYKIELIPVMKNLVDVIWPVRPKPKSKKLIVLDTFYSGKYQLLFPSLNPLNTKLSPKNAVFTAQSGFLATMTLNKPKFCQDSLFFTKRRDFLRITCTIEQYFNSGHAHKPKFGLLFWSHYPFSILFVAPFLCFFSALLVWLPFALHVLSGCREKLDVNYVRSLEMDLYQSQAQWIILPPFLHQT